MEENKNKKFLVSTIIGVLSMVIVVVGATYAYFTVGVQNNFTETKVSSKLENVGTVSLLPETTDMTLNLKVDDMLLKDDSVIYYATKEGATTLQSSEVIAKTSVSGEGIFNCTYDITMDATGSMYNAIQQHSTINNAVELWVDGVGYDFRNSNLFPKTVQGEIIGLSEDVSHDIVAQLRIANSFQENQDYLKGTDINITFKISNFKCTLTQESSNTKYIKETSPTNISTKLIDGLYRYQGTKDQVTNNYICWGTFDKDKCLSEGSKYLYRIIGFTPDGQIKIITTKLNQGVYGSISYVDGFEGDDLWTRSYVFSSINHGSDWTDLLVNKKWRYGDVTQETFANLTNVDEVLSIEKSFNNVVLAKAGLMSMSDFFNHDTCYTNYKYLNYGSTCKNGWLLLNSLDSSYDSSTTEWTSIRLNGTKMAFTINGVGGVGVIPIITGGNYRFVQYIAPNTYFTLKTGTGTITDPYIFS